MRKFIKKLTQLQKTVIVSVLAGLIVALPVTTFATWGPDRPTFDYNKLPVNGSTCSDLDKGQDNRCGSLDGPVFNSFIHTPSYGDERNFTTASIGDTADWHDSLDSGVTPGQEVAVRVCIHNNANQDLNG